MADARDRKEHLTASDGSYFVIDEVDAAHTDTSDTDTAADAEDIEEHTRLEAEMLRQKEKEGL